MYNLIKEVIMMPTAWKKTALVLDKNSMLTFKELSSDLSDISGQSISNTVLSCMVSSVAKTQKGQQIVKSTYLDEKPTCMKTYDAFFTDLWSGRGDRIDADKVVYSYLQYSIRFELRINLKDILVYHLREQWGSISRAFKRPATEDAEAAKALEEAILLGNSLDPSDGNASECSVSGYIAFILQNWRQLSECGPTYAALADIAKMSHASNKTAEENAVTRISLLRLIDNYYLHYRE